MYFLTLSLRDALPYYRASLLLGDLGGEQIADHALRLVLALHRRGGRLVEGGLHAIELQLALGGENLGTLHHRALLRSEEHTSELQSQMRIWYAVFCLKTKKQALLGLYNT